jgi:hypothetical protein
MEVKMIVKIKFSENLIMMFGDSYKPWHMQFDEWLWANKDKEINPITIEASSDNWIGWGGLKWCPERMFQDQLDREGCQENESDNPNPRQFKNMQFKNNPIVTAKVNKIIKDCRKSVSA